MREGAMTNMTERLFYVIMVGAYASWNFLWPSEEFIPGYETMTASPGMPAINGCGGPGGTCSALSRLSYQIVTAMAFHSLGVYAMRLTWMKGTRAPAAVEIAQILVWGEVESAEAALHFVHVVRGLISC